VRAGCGMSWVSRREGPERALLAAPGRDAVVTAAVLTATAAVFVAVAVHGTLAHIQRLDDAWLRLMISSRSAPVTAVAKFLNALGLVYVTLPVRIAIAGFLALRRRWWHLAAFAGAVLLSEILIGTLKGIYDRARPPGSLVTTSGASFPSGHSVAASVTVVAAVIALVPPGRRRAAWGTVAAGFSVLMGLSRAYLGAHWLSDAIAGILLGTSCALLAALVVSGLQRRWSAPRPGRSARLPVSDTARPADRL
jgi:membrane-associated phospholipid phosphatase